MNENERDYGLKNRVETLEMDVQLLIEEIARLEAKNEHLEALLRGSNIVMGDLHTDGAKADYPGYTLGMGDLYQLQVQIDANNAALEVKDSQ